MGIIFVLSGQQSLDSGLGWIDRVGRKLVHFGGYALLCALWWRALRDRLQAGSALAVAVAVTSAYAASDEFHQSFVEGRDSDPIDVLVDALGIAGALTVVRSFAARPR